MSKPEPDCTPWLLELDASRCSLCEVCARRCPSGALSVETRNETLWLVYRPALCQGCTLEESCQALCPEQAIRLTGRQHPAAETEVVLLESAMTRCSYCGQPFSPVRKLDSLAHKGQTKHDLLRDLCPLCRRTQLVVSFIETRRVPGSTAQYRSTKDILRRAGYKLGDSQKKGAGSR
jgi:ferredoxin